MGAVDYTVIRKGATARDTFTALREEALHLEGHGGYTGTIAEARSFKMLEAPKGVDLTDRNAVWAWVQSCYEKEWHPCLDKWGPACCVALPEGEWLFFGTAPS